MSDDLQKELEKRKPPKQSLEFQMDADRRVAVAVLTTERELLALRAPDPVVIPIPFHVMKEAVSQIITVEVELQLDKLPGGRNTPRDRWPKGLAGALHVAQKLMETAEIEAAGRAEMNDADPAFRPNLNVILGGRS